MDIPPFSPGYPGRPQSPPPLQAGVNSSNSIDNALVTQLGLRHEIPIKARAVSVQSQITSRPTEQRIWSALLEIETLIASLDASISSPPRLQVISALPLQEGQILSLMLDRNNRLQVVDESPNLTVENITTQRNALAQILAQTQLESTLPLANLLQVLTKHTLFAEHNIASQLLQNTPSLQNPDSLKHTIEDWIKNSARWQKTLMSADDELAKNSADKNNLPKETEPTSDIDALIKQFLKHILPLAGISSANFQDMKNPAQKTNQDFAIQQLIRYLKNILNQNTDTSLKNSGASLAYNQSLTADERFLSPLMQSLITRISTLHAQNHLTNINSSDNTQSFKLDIPLWIEDPLLKSRLGNVLLTIEKERTHKNNNKNKSIARRWRIMMEFDLEESGKLEAEALIRESQVNISLWAEQEKTQLIVQSKLLSFSEQLLKKGIPVEGIHFHLAKPQRKLSHPLFSLINVRG